MRQREPQTAERPVWVIRATAVELPTCTRAGPALSRDHALLGAMLTNTGSKLVSRRLLRLKTWGQAANVRNTLPYFSPTPKWIRMWTTTPSASWRSHVTFASNCGFAALFIRRTQSLLGAGGSRRNQWSRKRQFGRDRHRRIGRADRRCYRDVPRDKDEFRRRLLVCGARPRNLFSHRHNDWFSEGGQQVHTGRGGPNYGISVGRTPGRTPISVNLRKGISQPLPAGLCQLLRNFIPVPEGLGQTVRRQNRHADLVIHEFNLSPSAASHCPVGIPRGKTCRPPPPCVRPAGWRKSCHAARRARWPGLFSADAPGP